MASDVVRSHNESLLKTLKEGDMIEMPRWKDTFSHWAVYIGKGKVIHLSTDPNATSSATSSDANVFSIAGVLSKKAWVMENNLIEVAANSEARKNNGKDQKARPLDPKAIVKNARSKLGEIDYNILWWNCEHFASWCRYGDGWSEQTIDAMKVLGLIAVVGVGVVAVSEVSKALGDKKEEKN